MLAWNTGYDLRNKPRMPLPAAYEAALKALGPETNQFYCVGAFLDGACPKGDWVLRFCSANLAERYVTVCFDGQAQRSETYAR